MSDPKIQQQQPAQPVRRRGPVEATVERVTDSPTARDVAKAVDYMPVPQFVYEAPNMWEHVKQRPYVGLLGPVGLFWYSKIKGTAQQ